MIDKKTVEKIAGLAKIPFSSEELSILTKELDSIISFVQKLNELDVTNVPPTLQVTGKVNEFRNDKVLKSLGSESALKNVMEKRGDYIVTKGVFDAS